MTAKYTYALKRQKYRWTAGLTMATDVQYYNHLKLLGQASVATVAMLTNKGKLSKLWRPKARALVLLPSVLKLPCPKVCTVLSPFQTHHCLGTFNIFEARLSLKWEICISTSIF